MKRLIAAWACMCAVLSMAGCAPADRAVGDTQDAPSDVSHDSLHASDAVVGFVGSPNADGDASALHALASHDLNAVYAAGGASGYSDATAQNAVRDFTSRAVDVIVVGGIGVDDDNHEGWDSALNVARNAGIPVALLNPRKPPEDERYYAAALHVDDHATQSIPLADAVMAIVRDEPHERDVTVTTLDDESDN